MEIREGRSVDRKIFNNFRINFNPLRLKLFNIDGHDLWLRRRYLRLIINRAKRFNFKKVIHYTQKSFARRNEWLLRKQTKQPTGRRRPVFVMGSNKSGTQMVNTTIGKSLNAWSYHERDFRAFNSFYLRSDRVIDKLIRRSPAPIVTFGSINDSQSTAELLSKFEGARAVWVYRRYQDVANSAVRSFGSHHKDLARWVAYGELDRLGAKGEKIAPDLIRQFKKLYREDLSDEDGSCLYWYMRNQLFFELDLHVDPRVLLIQYEDAVKNPECVFKRIFDFLGFPFNDPIIDGIFTSSVGKHQWMGIDPQIQEICEVLQAKLDHAYEKSYKNGESKI